MIEMLRHAGSGLFLVLALAFLLLALFRDGFWRVVPTGKQESMAFAGLACLGIAFLLSPDRFR